MEPIWDGVTLLAYRASVKAKPCNLCWQETATNKGIKQTFLMTLKRLSVGVNFKTNDSNKRMGREFSPAPRTKIVNNNSASYRNRDYPHW